MTPIPRPSAARLNLSSVLSCRTRPPRRRWATRPRQPTVRTSLGKRATSRCSDYGSTQTVVLRRLSGPPRRTNSEVWPTRSHQTNFACLVGPWEGTALQDFLRFADDRGFGQFCRSRCAYHPVPPFLRLLVAPPQVKPRRPGIIDPTAPQSALGRKLRART